MFVKQHRQINRSSFPLAMLVNLNFLAFDVRKTKILTVLSQRFAIRLRLHKITTLLTMIRTTTFFLILLIFVLFNPQSTFGQQEIAWQRNLGTPYSDYGVQVFPDHSGNIVVIGKEPHADFAGNVKTYLVTAKFNPQGQEIWKTYHDVTFDVFSLPVDYGLGSHFYTVEFGDTLLNLVVAINDRVLQYKLLDRSGDFYFYEDILSSAVDVDLENEKVYAQVICSAQLACYGPDSLIVQRYDPSPDSIFFDPIEWSYEVRQNFRTSPIQGHYDFDVQDIRMDKAGNTYLLVQIERWDFQFCTDCADAFIDAWCEVFKFDPEGHLLKHVNLKTAKAVVSAMQLVRLDDDELIVQIQDINAAGTKVITSVYRIDGQLNVIKKFDLDGEYRSLVADDQLNLYGCRNIYDENNPEIHGLSDVYVVKFNADGQLQWDEYYGGSSWDFPVGMAIGADGGLYFLANTESTDVDVEANAGGQDIWLVRLGESTTATSPEPKMHAFRVYPNPTSTYVQLGNLQSVTRIGIYDHYGREIWDKEMPPGDARIELACLHPGLYTVRGVNAEGQAYIGRFVKE